MSYRTYFWLDIQNATNRQIAQILAYISRGEMRNVFYIRDDSAQLHNRQNNGVFTVDSAGDISWDEHNPDMIELSKKFPAVLFTLYGEGEDRYDMWRTYYRGGLLQYASATITITYDESNVAKLQLLE